MKKIIRSKWFLEEIKNFPEAVREEIARLIIKFLCGERLPSTEFKTFKLDSKIKVQEFKVKDKSGNWRAISCFINGDELVLVYGFHKKSQKLMEKDKKVIISRIRRLRNEQ